MQWVSWLDLCRRTLDETARGSLAEYRSFLKPPLPSARTRFSPNEALLHQAKRLPTRELLRLTIVNQEATISIRPHMTHAVIGRRPLPARGLSLLRPADDAPRSSPSLMGRTCCLLRDIAHGTPRITPDPNPRPQPRNAQGDYHATWSPGPREEIRYLEASAAMSDITK